MGTDFTSGVWPFRRPYLWLLVLTVVVAVFDCAYVYSGIPFSPLAEVLSVYTIPLAIMIWVVWDAQSRRCTPCYDFGLMVYVALYLALPGYLIWTRGWRGLLLLLGFILLFMAPFVCAQIAWTIRWGGM